MEEEKEEEEEEEKEKEEVEGGKEEANGCIFNFQREKDERK